MFVVGDKIISSELFSSNFACNLEKCKGSCCWEGDFGAPLEDTEIPMIQESIPYIREFLPEDARTYLDHNSGICDPVEKRRKTTALMPDGRCVFLGFDEDGIGKCSFEAAWQAGKTTFRKPISCHLYPVRVSQFTDGETQALNYDRWEICKAACHLGNQLNIPVFRFVKEAIQRKFGMDFYAELERIYTEFFHED